MTQQTQADFFNVPGELVYKGKAFKVRKPTQVEQAQFQRWLEDRARAAVDRADVDESRRRRMDADVTASIACGEYEYGTENCLKALRTPAGLARLLSIVLADQAVTPQMAEEMVEQHLMRIAELLFGAENGDPKALEATLTRLGLPRDFFTSSSRTPRSASRRKKSRR
jgi:hypothetical protein